jgi:hypothetical protein
MVEFELPVFHENPFPPSIPKIHITPKNTNQHRIWRSWYETRQHRVLSGYNIGVCVCVCVCVLIWNGNRVQRWRLQWIDLMLEWFLLTRKWGFSSWRNWKGWVLGMNCWRGPSEAVLSSFRAPLVMALKCYCSAVSCWQKSQITKKNTKSVTKTKAPH